MRKQNNNIEYISYLSVISAIAVIILHTNGVFWSFSKARLWITANIIECVFYFAVPIFFMITGITLLDYRNRYDTKSYFKKRITKTVIPFIIWSLISIAYRLIVGTTNINDLSLINIINGILSTKYLSIYWFFIPLFQIYLCIPFLSIIDKKNRNNIYIYIISTFLILNTIIPFINSIFNIGLTTPLSFTIVTQYLIYVLLGYLLNNHNISKKQETIIYILGIIGLLMHIIGTQYLSFKANSIITTYKGYCNVPCILYSIAIFTFVKNRLYIIKNNITAKIINILKKYTFSLYLMHWFIIDISIRLFNLNNHSIIFRLGFPFIIIPICVGITYIIRKIPILKRIVP